VHPGVHGSALRATISLYHLLDGELGLEVERQEIRVRRGDLVILPHGTAYTMRHRPVPRSRTRHGGGRPVSRKGIRYADGTAGTAS
jgi:uncharacterized cupin superfamily protein